MLNNRIMQFRTYNKLEASAVAKALDLDVNEYLKYEDGTLIPDIETITKLTQIYKVTINEFYGQTPRLTLHNDDNEKNEQEHNYELRFSELSVDEKDLILAYRTSENKEQIYKMILDKK